MTLTATADRARKLLALASSPEVHEAQSAAEMVHELLRREFLPLTYTVRPGTRFKGCPTRYLLSTERWLVTREFTAGEGWTFLESQRVKSRNTVREGFLLFERAGWSFVLPLQVVELR